MRVRYSFGSRHTGHLENIRKQKVKYPKVMKDVIRTSDIILEILDGRFIEETRNHDMEGKILDEGKILVYVINKSDLIDVRKVESELPDWMRPYVFVSATGGIGLGKLKGRIKMEAKRILKSWKESNDSRRRVQVGVIGYPNAGKSSVINFITRRGVAGTGKQAGFTRGMQKIRMSEGILILDTPGVIPESKYSTESETFAKDVKVGARTFSDVKDPEMAVYYLMKENVKKIENFYKINSKENADDFIEELGRQKKFLGKGGKVDVDRTARLVLRDWQEGKIK